MLIRGTATASGFDVGPSGLQGVVVDTTHDVSLGDFLIHGSGTLPGAKLAGQDGLLVKRTGSAHLVVSAHRPTLQSHRGDQRQQWRRDPCGPVRRRRRYPRHVGGRRHLWESGGSLRRRQGARTYELRMLDLDVYCNLGNGLYLSPATIPDNTTLSPSFAQNKFHGNAEPAGLRRRRPELRVHDQQPPPTPAMPGPMRSTTTRPNLSSASSPRTAPSSPLGTLSSRAEVRA